MVTGSRVGWGERMVLAEVHVKEWNKSINAAHVTTSQSQSTDKLYEYVI